MDELAEVLQQIEELAEGAKRALEVFTGRRVEVGEAAILDISAFIDSLGEDARQDRMRSRTLGLFMGALYGKCILSALGGEWFFDEASQQAAIRWKSARAFPFTQVARQIAGGRSETILAKYLALKVLLGAGD